MALSSNPNAYLHTKPILDLALANNGGTYELSSPAEAVRWRLEAYQYRKILAKDGPTPYDQLTIRLAGNVIAISIRAISGKFTTHDGTVIDVTQPLPEPVDPALDFALEFAKTLDTE